MSEFSDLPYGIWLHAAYILLHLEFVLPALDNAVNGHAFEHQSSRIKARFKRAACNGVAIGAMARQPTAVLVQQD